MRLPLAAIALVLYVLTPAETHGAPIDGFEPSPHFGEQTRTLTPDDGVRVLVNAAGDFDAARPTRLVVFALPNGNTIEQTMGCVTTPGMDWHFDIQHVAAQVRLVRTVTPGENVVVAAVEANTKSWPAWRKDRPDAPGRVRKIVEAVAGTLPKLPADVALTCHSGGGAFLFSYIDGGDAIPANVSRIVWLDANYAYDDPEKRHGDKLIAWLEGGDARRLVVVAYDDRNITLDGKKVVSDTGGTYRATRRMLDRFKANVKLQQVEEDDFDRFTTFDGRATFLVHRNPEVKILHTVLVERNGLVEALTLGTPAAGKWGGEFWGRRAYADLIQPAPANDALAPASPPTSGPPTPASATSATPAPASSQRPTSAAASPGVIPPRPADAPGGKAFAESIDDLPPAAREAAVVKEVLRGNVPEFLRTLKPVTLKSADGAHTCVVRVSPDYLAVGGDGDFVRVPITPASAVAICDAFGFALPTAKIVDAVYERATVQLEPRPLTEQREAVRTFARHNGLIEEQRKGKPLGELVAGIKKDVVVTNKLKAKPNRVAIYGWHTPDGKPIQPLYAGHVDWYVDYSHGIRLVAREATLDGKPADLLDLLADPKTCTLIGEDEPIVRGPATYQAPR